jgi:hypothetical protein
VEFDIPIATAVFFSSMAIDGLGAYYTKKVAEGEAGKATGAGLLIGILGYVNLAAFLGDPKMMVPELAGGAIGTYFVVKAGRTPVRPEDWVV